MDFDAERIRREVEFLTAYPWFDERPASIIEFLGEGYLEIEKSVRPGLRQALIDIFGDEVNPRRISKFQDAMFTGAIGIGKTTFASIALPYMCHWVLCLRNPQDYFELMPGSKIAFMQMSTSQKQATGVVFGDIFARIKNSPWFVNNYPYDDRYEKEIKFAKDIWVLPGGSAETMFEGYNILGGVLDEMDSHKTTDEKDYADVGYDAINSRVASRFPILGDDGEEVGHKGLVICIGQMKKATGFAARKYEELLANRDRAYVWRQTIWESYGWERYRNKTTGEIRVFYYDSKRKKIIPEALADMLEENDHVIKIPITYLKQFETNPEKALRDLAGIPPASSDPFISLVDRIEACRDRWIKEHGDESPVVEDVGTRVKFNPWFKARNDPRKRHIHIDLGISPEGDALGMAMGHVDHIVEVEGEEKPHITFDCLIRMFAPPGQEILISEVRQVVYYLKDMLNFRIHSISMDGFQSTDSLQQFRKKRYIADYLSVDKSTLPYEDLRDAIYEGRCDFPPYIVPWRLGDTRKVEIAVKELMELNHNGKKIDHPPQGSKDVADAMAGTCHMLMGDRTYRKGVRSSADRALDPDTFFKDSQPPDNGMGLPMPGASGLQAPLPPQSQDMMGLTLPARLQPQKGRR